MKKTGIIFFCPAVECLIIIAISVAALFSGGVFALFYNAVYGVLLSVLLPLYLTVKNGEGFSSLGIKKMGARQIIVLFVFAVCSVAGQLLPKLAAGQKIAWHLLPICFIPLIMTTFFEEFLFRGFVQTRVEKQFGTGIAVAVSALMFSLYHLGYPGFRNTGGLLLLFAVGLGFALAYTLSGNNLFSAYFVNLPNALVTYMLKSEQFPPFTAGSSLYAAGTILILIGVFIMARRKIKADNETAAVQNCGVN